MTGLDPGSGALAASVLTEGATEHRAGLVVGADGARSTVRTAVDRERPDAWYAQVLLWRSLVDEQAMPERPAACTRAFS